MAKSRMQSDFEDYKSGKAQFSREFTFTGYDISADEMPKAEETERESIEALYCSICAKLKIIPVSYVQKRLADKTINIRSRGLGPKGTRAIAVALVNNTSVDHLDLSDNAIETEGAMCVAQMMSENTTITHLDLSDNYLGDKGISVICDAISRHETLMKLNLSGTGCQDKQTIYIKRMLDTNMHLRELKLCHNRIGDEGCLYMKKAICDNDTLEILDLSWNHIRGKSAIAIANGLKENRGLRGLNISWNGFALEGCRALSEALYKNKTLTELNIQANRIHTEALKVLIECLKRNTTLKTLKLSKNLLTPEAAHVFLKVLDSVQNNTLTEIDLADIPVSQEFLDLLHSVQEKRPLRLSHGPLMTNTVSGRTKHQLYLTDISDPRALLLELMERDGLRVIDLFQRLDEDRSWTVSRNEFKNGIMKANMSVTEGQLDALVDIMDYDGNNEIDLREMLVAQRDFKKLLIKARMSAEKTRTENVEIED